MVAWSHLLGAMLPLLVVGLTLSATANAAPVSCQIHVERAPGGVRLVGHATASQAIAGQYTFLIDKDGPSGTSRVTQGNDFTLAAGGSVQIGEVSLGIEDGDTYRARLDLTWPGGSVSCVESSQAKL